NLHRPAFASGLRSPGSYLPVSPKRSPNYFLLGNGRAAELGERVSVRILDLDVNDFDRRAGRQGGAVGADEREQCFRAAAVDFHLAVFRRRVRERHREIDDGHVAAGRIVERSAAQRGQLPAVIDCAVDRRRAVGLHDALAAAAHERDVAGTSLETERVAGRVLSLRTILEQLGLRLDGALALRGIRVGRAAAAEHRRRNRLTGVGSALGRGVGSRMLGARARGVVANHRSLDALCRRRTAGILRRAAVESERTLSAGGAGVDSYGGDDSKRHDNFLHLDFSSQQLRSATSLFCLLRSSDDRAIASYQREFHAPPTLLRTFCRPIEATSPGRSGGSYRWRSELLSRRDYDDFLLVSRHTTSCFAGAGRQHS